MQDVKLQMDAKLWAEEYNRHDPPKKVSWWDVLFVGMLDGFIVDNIHHVHLTWWIRWTLWTWWI